MGPTGPIHHQMRIASVLLPVTEIVVLISYIRDPSFVLPESCWVNLVLYDALPFHAKGVLDLGGGYDY